MFTIMNEGYGVYSYAFLFNWTMFTPCNGIGPVKTYRAHSKKSHVNKRPRCLDGLLGHLSGWKS